MRETVNLLRALHFAADRHQEQRRKGSTKMPYINHLIGVALLLAETGGVTDETLLLGGVLHDTVEDTKTTFEELEAAFGKPVADLVREVTDDKKLSKEQRKELQVQHAATASPLAKQLKIADKISNLRDVLHHPPEGWSDERRREYFEWAARVVANCRGYNPGLEAAFDALLAEGRRQL
jgi:guanosine-3',5'-bis(diphosphate) 3'-pyrophosphohydrolase